MARRLAEPLDVLNDLARQLGEQPVEVVVGPLGRAEEQRPGGVRPLVLEDINWDAEQHGLQELFIPGSSSAVGAACSRW